MVMIVCKARKSGGAVVDVGGEGWWRSCGFFDDRSFMEVVTKKNILILRVV